MGRDDADLRCADAPGVWHFLCSKHRLVTYPILCVAYTDCSSKLLSILGIGFAQGLYALDAADGETEHGASVINALIQALLQ